MTLRRWAVMNGEDVTNVILLDKSQDEFAPDEGEVLLLAGAEVGPGWKRIDGEWVAPILPERQPQEGDDPL